MTRLLGVLLLGLLTMTSARVISESVFMDMCEAHGRAAGRVAAASSCNTLKAVCLPSETSGRAVFYEDPYFDSVIIDVLRESCELLYKSVCRQTAYQTARRQPACSKILLGSHFATAFCPDVETAVDIFSEGLAECDEIPNMLFEVAGMKKGSGSGKVNSKKKKKNRNKKKSSDEEFPFSTAFLRSTLGRTLKSVTNRLPPKSGVPNDPCDCTDHLSGGQQVDFVGCEHQVCYVVGKDCGVAFPSAKYPGAFMRLCTAT